MQDINNSKNQQADQPSESSYIEKDTGRKRFILCMISGLVLTAIAIFIYPYSLRILTYIFLQEFSGNRFLESLTLALFSCALLSYLIGFVSFYVYKKYIFKTSLYFGVLLAVSFALASIFHKFSIPVGIGIGVGTTFLFGFLLGAYTVKHTLRGKKILYIFPAIILLTVLFFVFNFCKLFVLVNIEVRNQKNEYKLGDIMVVEYKVRNISPLKSLYSIKKLEYPDIRLVGDKVYLHRPLQPAIGTSSYPTLAPFELIEGQINVVFVNELSWVNDAAFSGVNEKYDVYVKPGENILIVDIGKEKKIKVNINKESYQTGQILCDDFELKARKQLCLRRNPEQIKIGDCDETDNSLFSLACFREYGYATKDKNNCLEIEDLEFRDECLTGVYNTTDDPSVCELLSNEPHKKNCYYHMGHTLGAHYCTYISNKDENANCFKINSKNFRDFSKCNEFKRIEDSRNCYAGICWNTENLAMDECFYEAAIFLKDKKFCERIASEVLAKECLENIWKKKDTSIVR